MKYLAYDITSIKYIGNNEFQIRIKILHPSGVNLRLEKSLTSSQPNNFLYDCVYDASGLSQPIPGPSISFFWTNPNPIFNSIYIRSENVLWKISSDNKAKKENLIFGFSDKFNDAISAALVNKEDTKKIEIMDVGKAIGNVNGKKYVLIKHTSFK